MRWRRSRSGRRLRSSVSRPGDSGSPRAGVPNDETLVDESLVVVQQAPEQQFVDLGAPGPSPGDILAFHSTLTDSNGNDLGDLNSLAAIPRHPLGTRNEGGSIEGTSSAVSFTSTSGPRDPDRSS